jgi:menaquinone-dependent protoporphyrinogen oxidase
MRVLVTVASRHGATKEIAERIADVLRADGLEVEVKPLMAAGELTSYDAFVIGSALYFGSWLKEATEFVRSNHAVLSEHAVWLFSSGPIGAKGDEQGQDVRKAAEPKQLAEVVEALRPRDHRVFFGRLERRKLGLLHRLVASLPAFPGSEGDFRDWDEVRTWARGNRGDSQSRAVRTEGVTRSRWSHSQHRRSRA